MIEAYKAYWKNYANFKDQTTRAGFWWVILVNIIIGVVLQIIAVLTGSVTTAEVSGITYTTYTGIFGLVSGLWSLANLVPELAIAVRRMHNIGRRWLSLLLGFIPIVGEIILIVLFAKREVPAPENPYGNSPRV